MKVKLTEIREFLAAQVASGESVAAFARSRGVAPKLAYRWLARLRRSEGADEGVGAGFYELRPAPARARVDGETEAGLQVDLPNGAGRVLVRTSAEVPLAVLLLRAWSSSSLMMEA